MQIKSQPLANKILGLADKTSFTGADFTLPACNKIYPLISVLPLKLNIARDTTDQEIDSVTWTKFSDHKAWSADGHLH